MSEKEREIEGIVKNFKMTLGKLRVEVPEPAETLLKSIRDVHNESVLSIKEKELICLGISLGLGCESCIVMHMKSALEAGATKKEIMETLALAVTLKGTSSIGDISIGIKAYDEFTLKSSIVR